MSKYKSAFATQVMVKLGKRKDAKRRMEQEQMDEEIIGSPSKALFGDDPHEKQQVMDVQPKFIVDVSYLKEEAQNYKVLISRDYIYSKMLKKKEGRRELVAYLQILMMKQDVGNYLLFKCISGDKGKPMPELKNFGSDYKKAQAAFMDSFRELIGSNFVEQFVEYEVARGLETDEIDAEISKEVANFKDKPLGQLAKQMFNLKNLEQGLRNEGVNITLLKNKTLPQSSSSISTAYNILLRIKESLETSKYSDLIGAAVEGLSMKFFEKIPHNLDLLEARKYNINSDERIKAKVTLLRLIQAYEDVYGMHARLRACFDFSADNSLQNFFMEQLGGFSLETLSIQEDREAIHRNLSSGFFSHKCEVGEIYRVSQTNQSGLSVVDLPTGPTELLWTACRVECLTKHLKQEFVAEDFVEEINDLLLEGSSTSLFDCAEAALGSLKRSSCTGSIALVLCEVLKSEESLVVSTEEELIEAIQNIKTRLKQGPNKTKLNDKKKMPPTILKGRNMIDGSESIQLSSHNARISVGQLITSDSITSDYLFGKTIVHAKGWIVPRYIVRLKSSF